MEPQLKRLAIENYDQIIELWAVAGLPFRPHGRDSRELMAKEMNFPGAAFFGLYVDELMVGVCIANYDGRRGWINRLAIHPDFRGKKLSHILIEAGEKFLYSIGAHVICALIEELNYPSMTTFNKAGYNCEEHLHYFAKRPSADM